MPPKRKASGATGQSSAVFGDCGINLQTSLADFATWFVTLYNMYLPGKDFKTLIVGYIDALTNSPQFLAELLEKLGADAFSIYEADHVKLRNARAAKTLTSYLFNKIVAHSTTLLFGNETDAFNNIDAEGDTIIPNIPTEDAIKKTRGLLQLKKKLDDYSKEFDPAFVYHVPKAPKKTAVDNTNMLSSQQFDFDD